MTGTRTQESMHQVILWGRRGSGHRKALAAFPQRQGADLISNRLADDAELLASASERHTRRVALARRFVAPNTNAWQAERIRTYVCSNRQTRASA